MSRFIKLENIIEVSPEMYNVFHRNDAEKAHAAAMRKAATRYINALDIDEFIEIQHTSGKGDDAVTQTACYLILRHDAGVHDISGSGPHDRIDFVVIPGTAEEWKTKVEQAIAADAKQAFGISIIGHE